MRRIFARSVSCATCHGDMTKQTTAERKVDMNMGYCIKCHEAKAGLDRLRDLSLLKDRVPANFYGTA